MRTKTLMAIMILAGALFLLFSPISSKADTVVDTINFFNITNNGNANLSSQLSVQIIDTGISGQVGFKFLNNVGIVSSITDVYFDDGTLLAISTIVSSTGVSFASPATPNNLPGGNNITPPFVVTDNFSADSNTPNALANGVNASTESLEIIFNLVSTADVDAVIAALNNGSLRIGMHVQGIGTTNGSDGYVNKVPEPGILILLGIAMSAVGVASRYVRKI